MNLFSCGWITQGHTILGFATFFFNIFNLLSVEPVVRSHGYGGLTVRTVLSVCIQVAPGMSLEEESLSGS